jgi:hypothetical protein
LRELAIVPGNNVLDDNILATSPDHRRRVFNMLRAQPERARFTGGLEAKLVTPEIAAELIYLNPEALFFAYDEEADWGPLVRMAEIVCTLPGGRRLLGRARVYLLCGYPKDTMEAAELRALRVARLVRGMLPYAMLWRNHKGEKDPVWRAWQYTWSYPPYARNRADALEAVVLDGRDGRRPLV